MNRNLLIVISGGVVIALLVAFMLQLSLSGRTDSGPKKAEIKTVEVLVADKNKRLGEKLSNNDLRWQEWPEKALFNKAIVRKEGESPIDRISGRLVRNISKGQPVLKSAVSASSGDNILATRMEKNQRGVAIKVDAASMVGGFISPGDHVDVLMTYQMRMSRDNAQIYSTLINQYATETVLEDVQVLATDQEAVRHDNEAEIASTVTLAVTPEQAEALALASKMGDLHLALRPIGDKERKKKENIDEVAELFMGETTKRMQKQFKGMTTDVRIADVMRSINAMKSGGDMQSQNMRIFKGNGVQAVSARQ